MALPIIEPTTDAVTTEGIVFEGDLVPATLIALGLQSGEEIGVQINNGFGWENIRFGSGEFKITYETAHTRVIQSRARLRFVKPITTNPVSLGAAVKDDV